MSFKLNDYNAFLSSLVERDKDGAIVISPDLQIGDESAAQTDKLPIDFDFCLYDKNGDKKRNPKLNGADGSNMTSLNSNSNIPNKNSSLSMSISPRSDDNLFNENNDQMIDNIMKDKFYDDPIDNSAFMTNKDVFIKQESSDDDLLSPDLELPDNFYKGFNGINDAIMRNPDNDLKKTLTIDSLSSLSNSVGNSFSTSNTNNGLHGQRSKRVSAVEMLQSVNKSNKLQHSKQKPLVNFKAFDDKDDKDDIISECMDPESREFRPRMRSSHNVIEQRYRNKINDKFTALQNSVPTLRIVAKRKQKHEDVMDDDPLDPERYELSESDSDDLEGLEPARKLNKGIILSKSIEYIKFLELKNTRMRQQQSELVEKAKLLGISLDELLF